MKGGETPELDGPRYRTLWGVPDMNYGIRFIYFFGRFVDGMITEKGEEQ
jgi:hypothetical protein